MYLSFTGIYADIIGKCKVHWTTSHSRRVNDRTEHYTVTHESHEEYINTTIYLIGSKHGELLLMQQLSKAIPLYSYTLTFWIECWSGGCRVGTSTY